MTGNQGICLDCQLWKDKVYPRFFCWKQEKPEMGWLEKHKTKLLEV